MAHTVGGGSNNVYHQLTPADTQFTITRSCKSLFKEKKQQQVAETRLT